MGRGAGELAKTKKPYNTYHMKLNYTYEMDGTFFVGYLDDYPEHPTQGETLEDFEENLLDIYHMIQDGTLEARKHGVLELAR